MHVKFLCLSLHYFLLGVYLCSNGWLQMTKRASLFVLAIGNEKEW